MFISHLNKEQRLFQAIRKTIVMYTQLEPGWDGYSGKAVSKELALEALFVAREFIAVAPAITKASADTGNGEQVTLNFEMDLVKLSVEIDPDDLTAPVPEYTALITRSHKAVVAGVKWDATSNEDFKVVVTWSLGELYGLLVAANRTLNQQRRCTEPSVVKRLLQRLRHLSWFNSPHK